MDVEEQPTEVSKPVRGPAVYCRLSPRLFEKLRQLAEADERTLPDMVRRLISKARLEA